MVYITIVVIIVLVLFALLVAHVAKGIRKNFHGRR